MRTVATHLTQFLRREDALSHHLAVHIGSHPVTDRGDAYKTVSTAELVNRIDQELAALGRSDLLTEVIVVAELASWLRADGYVVGTHRGYFPHSLVFNLLGITEIDPYRLIPTFDLFLNFVRQPEHELVLEVSDKGRQAAIEHLRATYGMKAVFPIASKSMQSCSRFLTDRIRRALPRESIPEADLDIHVRYANEHISCLSVDFARVVVSGPLAGGNLLPISYTSDLGIFTECNASSLSTLPSIVLSLMPSEEISIIEETQAQLRSRGVSQSLYDADTNDRAFTLIRRGGIDLYGRFCRQFLPRDLDDLAAMIALVRPQLEGKMQEYMERRDGKAEPKSPHPLLEGCFSDTFGIPIFNEQIFQVLRSLTQLPTEDLLALWKSMRLGGDRREVFIDSCMEDHDHERGDLSAVFDVLSDAAASTLSQSIAIGIAKVIRRSAELKASFPDVYKKASKQIKQSKMSVHDSPEHEAAAVTELREFLLATGKMGTNSASLPRPLKFQGQIPRARLPQQIPVP